MARAHFLVAVSVGAALGKLSYGAVGHPKLAARTARWRRRRAAGGSRPWARPLGAQASLVRPGAARRGRQRRRRDISPDPSDGALDGRVERSSEPLGDC